MSEVDTAMPIGSSATGTWPPRPAALGRWPLTWRQQWAERASELEDAGLDWREAERLAFIEVSLRLDPRALREYVSDGDRVIRIDREPVPSEDDPDPARWSEILHRLRARARPGSAPPVIVDDPLDFFKIAADRGHA